MAGKYKKGRLKRRLKNWTGLSSGAGVFGLAMAFGTGAALTLDKEGAGMGISLPGPEHTMALAIPQKPVAERVSVAPQEVLRVVGSGQASFYGPGFAGRPTASGEIFNPSHLTAAHPSLPFGSKVRVTNQSNGREVVVRINDRGPFAKNRIIDLSTAAASQIGMVNSGTANVTLELLA